MLLTITSSSRPATDLGFLLHKHPERVQEFSLPFGRAHVFYPEATEERTTAALLVEIDPVSLVKRRGRGQVLTDYVNDRPYVASSFMSVAIARVFGSALKGQSESRRDLVGLPLALEARLAVVASFDGESALRRLFEPLGYVVEAIGHPLNPQEASWGDSPYFTLTIRAEVALKDLLGHLYVLLPVLDGGKHYWVDESEVDKLIRAGEGWLGDHPERELIARRYLKGQHWLTEGALERLLAEEVATAEAAEPAEDITEGPERTPLNRVRLDAVADQLVRLGARRIVDVGCGEGRLIESLLRHPSVEQVTGMDVSVAALRKATSRLRIDDMSPRQRRRVDLIQGSLTYRDDRLRGFDAAAVVEVIEHLDPWRLDAFERVIFDDARPGSVIVTTPNAEYNVEYGFLEDGTHRHADHRFEWTRSQFADWAGGVAERRGYSVEVFGIGDEVSGVGTPTQMAVFQAGERTGDGSR